MSTTTTPAVTNLAAVIVPVSDQDKMVDFYTEALGLEKRTDVPFGGGVEGRWVEVAPGGAQTPIALCPPGPDNEAGGRETGISLRTADIKATTRPQGPWGGRGRGVSQPRRARSAALLAPRPRGEPADGRRDRGLTTGYDGFSRRSPLPSPAAESASSTSEKARWLATRPFRTWNTHAMGVSVSAPLSRPRTMQPPTTTTRAP